MTEEKKEQQDTFLERKEIDIMNGIDNRIGYDNHDDKSSKKLLIQFDNDISHQEINKKDMANLLIVLNDKIRKSFSTEVLKATSDPIQSFEDETHRKELIENKEFDCQEEKNDLEKEWDDVSVQYDSAQDVVNLKEYQEESEKTSRSDLLVACNDSLYVNYSPFESMTDYPEEEVRPLDTGLVMVNGSIERVDSNVSDMTSFFVSDSSFENTAKYPEVRSLDISLVAQNASIKTMDSNVSEGSSLFICCNESLGEFSSFENMTNSPEEEVSFFNTSLKEGSSELFIFENNLNLEVDLLGSMNRYIEQSMDLSDEKDMKAIYQRSMLCLTDELSIGESFIPNHAFELEEMCLNIRMISFERDGTSSFNGCYEDKINQANANLLFNNDITKNATKKSPLSFDNRHIVQLVVESADPEKCNKRKGQLLDLDEKSSLTHSPKTPRQRSGSHNKSRGRRRSKRHGHNKGAGAGKNGASGGAGSGMDSPGGGGGGGGSGGNGRGDEDDKNKKKENDTAGRRSDEEEDDDESDDETEIEKDEEEVGKDGSLLQTTAAVRDDRGLTDLLMTQNGQAEGIVNWRMESENLSIGSLPQEFPQQDEEDVMTDHSCISCNEFLDILGAAAKEDYRPPNLPLNPCLTVLTHNMSFVAEPLDCDHCSTMSLLLQHIAKCEIGLTCEMCLQGNNIILYHVKTCIETKRQFWPYSRMDLCFKLCQNAKWNVEELYGSCKIHSKLTIQKYCCKVRTMPFDSEISSLDLSLKDLYHDVSQENQAAVEPANDRLISDQTTNASGRVMGKTLRSSSSHTSLCRKPSNSRRSIAPLPPCITEDEEDEDKEKDETENEKVTEDSAETILRRNYGQKTAEDPAASRERDYVFSLPQGRINDQTQFNSLVSEAKGVKGVGEVVYSNVAQLRLVANFWDQKKEEFKATRKRPYQRAEEGVILEKYKSKFQILGTRYQLDYQWHKLTPLGSGMTGRCYLAVDKQTGFRFCIKKMYLVDYKKEELCLWSDLNHQNIVTLYGAIRHSDIVYLLSEYIDGGDLGHCIDEHKSRGERVSHWLALTFFQQLLDVLVYLESKNLLHEDIKADNILLRSGDFRIVLTDFGLCHRLQKAVELKNKVPAGTATHFSPEKAASMGHGFPACVWACVCVLVHMLSGQQPWHKYLKKVDYLNFTIYMKPPPLEDLPHNVREIVKDLIARGFTKDPDRRPNARQLLQHEAFNIINQEPETYFSNLASTFLSNAAATSTRNQKDKGSVVQEAATVRDVQENSEREVSLYEITRQRSGVVHVSGISDTRDNVNKTSKEQKTGNSEEKEEDAVIDGELEGAVGGEMHRATMTGTIVREDVQRTDAPVLLNRPSGSAIGGDKSAQESNNPGYWDLIDNRIPALDMLLQSSSSESTISYLTDSAVTNLNVPGDHNLPLNLEVFNPTNTAVNSNSVSSDQLPNLSIFDPYSWDKNLPSSRNSSSEAIDSTELFAPGMEVGNSPQTPMQASTQSPSPSPTLSPTHPLTHFKEKKPADLKLNVSRPPLKQQGSQEKSTLSTSRASNSTATIPTASSQGSSVFYNGTSSAAIDRDFKDIRCREENEEKDEQQADDDEGKKVVLALANLRESINEDTFDDMKLTLYNENGEKLFSYRISRPDTELQVKHHISVFKAKISFKHFELMTMDGNVIDYNSRLKKVSQLMVVAQSDNGQCWCAGCQF